MAELESVDVNGVRYAYRDSGDGSEVVVMLHGWPDDGTVWRHQASALTEAGYRVIVPDLPGYGASDAPAEVERYAFGMVATDLIALLDELDVERAHLVAHDYGAAIGWVAATMEPERLASFVAISVGHPSLVLEASFEEMRYQWYLMLHLQDRAPELYRAAGGRVFADLIRSHPEKDRLVAELIAPGRFETLQRWERANISIDLLMLHAEGQLPTAPAITVPTFAIWPSADDYLWERQLAESERLVDAAWSYMRIAGAGHWVMLERPEQVSDALLRWLASQRSEAVAG